MTPAEALTAALGGRWFAGERYGACRCPAHDDRQPSLSIRDGERRPLVKCHAGCDGESIVTELKRRNLWPVGPTHGPPAQVGNKAGLGHDPAAPSRPKRTAEESRRYILELWRSCRPAEGTHVEIYLRGRGITMEIPPSIRFHPALKHTDTGLPFPAMAAAVQGPDRQICGLHRTFLRADGEGKAQVSSPRKMLGSVRGGAVRLAAAGPEIAVGEGIETGLSYQQITGTPTWAALSSAGLMAVSLPPPPMAETVNILVDLDPAGEQAAEVAARRFDGEGRRVNLVRPTSGKDINDLVKEAAP
jgi:putative DNA primase/helicase